jgi:4-hydroxy-4-methyl-2-oxoglutarate aldolase
VNSSSPAAKSDAVSYPAPLPAGVIDRAKALGSASVHEAAKRVGALPAAIKPVARPFRIAGPAFTVWSPPKDNLWLHRALVAARPGDVLVVYTGGFYEAGYWGEIMSTAAAHAQLGGLVIDACVRDGSLLEGIGFPVFSRGLAIQGTQKDFGALGALNRPVLIGNVVVAPGDLLIGDEDGVVCIKAEEAAEVTGAAITREEKERAILERLRAGESTLDVYGLHQRDG